MKPLNSNCQLSKLSGEKLLKLLLIFMNLHQINKSSGNTKFHGEIQTSINATVTQTRSLIMISKTSLSFSPLKASTKKC